MKASEYIQKWCDKHGSNGKNWRETVSRVAPDDVFNFNTVPIDYRPFDRKFVYYTGRIGIISAPRWAIMKHFLLSTDCQWRYGTERLLWVYEDKPNEELSYECRLTIENMEQCPLDEQWLCDFNMFRVAFGMMQIQNRKIINRDIFGKSNARKIELYDPQARPQGFVLCGNEWENYLKIIGDICQ